MSFDGFMQYLIPLVFLYYAYMLGIKKPPYGDNRGFPTKRAKENEEIWNYVQRLAAKACLVLAIVLAISAFATEYFLGDRGSTAYYLQIAIELVCIFGLVPAVNLITNRKYPKSK